MNLISRRVIVYALIVVIFFMDILINVEWTTTPKILVQQKFYGYNKSVKYILIWNDNFNILGGFTKRNLLDSCAVKNCLVTYDRDMVPSLQDFDAIIFHIPGKSFFSRSPAVRSAKQKYIFFSMESPYNFRYVWNHYDFYNWTMTYRKDSDIHHPYNMVVKAKINYRTPSIEEIQQKKSLVAWFVSDCKAQRINYVRKLQEYIRVDIYGKCGTPCENRTACYDMLNNDYKFYLSFENSLCADYVTEKLFNILKLNVVPIVMGSANYSEVAPPHSVIQVRDFASAKDLSKYLLYLHSHPKEYLSYFKWKSEYRVTFGSEIKSMVLCETCKKLNEPINYSSYKDIYDWYNGPNYSVCQYR